MSIPAQGAVGAGQSYQERVRQHFLYVAGDDTTDMPERRDRSCEEFAELQQALGGTLEGWIAVGRYVWGRPIGEPAQEMGGTLNTLAALAAWADLDMMACAEAELERTKRPEIVAKIRRKRANRHGRGVLPGNDADLVTAALASPRADSDERTAGEDEWQRVPKEVRKVLADLHLAGSISLRKGLASELAEIIKGALVAATPAQPAGAVPDSLRALSEAAQIEMRARASRCAASFIAREPKAIRAGMTAEYIRGRNEAATTISAWIDNLEPSTAALASHPAGQSAGSPLCSYVECAALGKSSCEDCRDTPRRAEQSAGSGAEHQRDMALEALHTLGVRLGVLDPSAACDGPQLLTAMDAYSESLTAPDSTRTGQGEVTEEMISAGAACLPSILPLPERRAYFREALAAALATRPAAPEAQGAWSFNMEAAPRDGTSVLVAGPSLTDPTVPFVGEAYVDADNGGHWWWAGTSYGDYHAAPLHEVGFKPYAWHPMLDAPAPSASSGQGGR